MAGGFVCRMHGGSAPQVRRKAAERLADLIDPDRVLRETAGIAYSDLRELFDEKGALRPLKDLPANVAASIASVEVVRQNLTPDDDAQEWVHKVKLWDKTKALDMLMRHLALYKDQLKLGLTPDAEKLVAALQAGRERVAKERSA
jgi:phage terminase small subunit